MIYGSVGDMIDYLAVTGRALPPDANPAEALAMGSMWVDGFEDIFCGSPATDESSFPRDGSTVVPVRVEQAAYEAAYAFANGADIFGTGGTAGGQVIEERVDVLGVKYAAPTGDWWRDNRYIVPLAYSKLLPLICLPDDSPKGCRGGPAAFIV